MSDVSVAGKSSYIGADVCALSALFAGLFLPRQGVMFCMIHGALVCEKAGVPMQTYVEQLPLTRKLVHDYYDVFAASVTMEDFSNPPVNIATLHAAFEDVLDTFEHCGVANELPQLLHRLMQQGVDAGLAQEQVTASSNPSRAISWSVRPQRTPSPPGRARAGARASARRRRDHEVASPGRHDLGAALAPRVRDRHQTMPALRRTASVLALITDPRVIAAILAHLEFRAARAPPPTRH